MYPLTRDDFMRERVIGDKVAYFDSGDKLEYEEVSIQNIFLGKVEILEGKNKSFTVWKDDEKILNEIPNAS